MKDFFKMIKLHDVYKMNLSFDWNFTRFRVKYGKNIPRILFFHSYMIIYHEIRKNRITSRKNSLETNNAQI